MVRNYQRKTNRGLSYTRQDLQDAVDAVKSKRLTLTEASVRFSVPKPTIADHAKNRRGVKSKTFGRPTALSLEAENQLGRLIKLMEKYGYGLSKKNVLQLVSDYIIDEKIPNPFKNNFPGDEWWLNFKKRQRLSIKKPQNVEVARKKAQNPFTIFGYFDRLKITLDELNIQPSNIWNLDESAFSHDPSKTKIVGGKGVPATRTVTGPGRENTTVLLACSAMGDKCPPLFIFKGKNVWNQWIPNESEGFPGSTFAATSKGWMESSVFLNYFEYSFVKAAKPSAENPVLLIYDGHATHISLKLAKLAVKKHVTILLLPPHSSHLLQPLDLAVFKSIKSSWDEYLCKRLRQQGCQKISKRLMTIKIGELWNSLDTDIIKSGFRKAGIFPFNKDVIPKEHFDQLTLERWEQSLKSQIDQDVIPEIDQAMEEPEVDQVSTYVNDQGEASEIDHDAAFEISELAAVKADTNNLSINVETGNVTVLLNNEQEMQNSLNTELNTFEKLLLSTISSHNQRDQPTKKTKVCLGSKVITSQECMLILKEKEDTEKQKKAIKEDKENQRKMKKAQISKDKSKKPKKKKVVQKKKSKVEEMSLSTDDEVADDEVQFNVGNDITDGDFAEKLSTDAEFGTDNLPIQLETELEVNDPENNLFPFLKPNESITLEVTETGIGSLESTSQALNNKDFADTLNPPKKPGDFVLVKYESTRKTVKIYLGAIKEIYNDEECLIRYLRCVDKEMKIFKFHKTDQDIVPLHEIMNITIPHFEMDSKGCYVFEDPIPVLE